MNYSATDRGQGPEFTELSNGPMAFVPLGITEVEHEQFRAEIQPNGDSLFMMGMIGMRPVARGADKAAPVDPEHVERLRALGYIE